MSDSIETLIRMANQIAANLAHAPDPVAATAEHIRLFWDPRMREKILAVGKDGGLGLPARAAVEQLRRQ